MSRWPVFVILLATTTVALAGCTSSPGSPGDQADGIAGPGGDLDSQFLMVDVIGNDTLASQEFSASGSWAAGEVGACTYIVGAVEETIICTGEPRRYDIADLFQSGQTYHVELSLTHDPAIIFNPMNLGLSIENADVSTTTEFDDNGAYMTAMVTVFEVGVAEAAVSRTIPQEANDYTLVVNVTKLDTPRPRAPIELTLDSSATELSLQNAADDQLMIVWDSDDQFVDTFRPNNGSITIRLEDIKTAGPIVVGFAEWLGEDARWLVMQDAEAAMPHLRYLPLEAEFTILGELNDGSAKQWDFDVDSVPFALGLWWGGETDEEVWTINSMAMKLFAPNEEILVETSQNCTLCVGYRHASVMTHTGAITMGNYILNVDPDSSGGVIGTNDVNYASGAKVGYRTLIHQR